VKKKFLDTDHPWFRPLWVRILVVAACAGWAIVEFVTGSPFWAVIFLGLGAYAGYGFFFDFHPGEAAAKPPPDTD
jgi:hypothetical protein